MTKDDEKGREVGAVGINADMTEGCTKIRSGDANRAGG